MAFDTLKLNIKERDILREGGREINVYGPDEGLRDLKTIPLCVKQFPFFYIKRRKF